MFGLMPREKKPKDAKLSPASRNPTGARFLGSEGAGPINQGDNYGGRGLAKFAADPSPNLGSPSQVGPAPGASWYSRPDLDVQPTTDNKQLKRSLNRQISKTVLGR